MGIAQVGREKVLPPLMSWPGCPPVCLTEPDDGIRSDRQSGASGIVKPLFCARAMREKGAKVGWAGPCPKSVPSVRGARTASGKSWSRADLQSAHSKSGNVSGAIHPRAAWPTICSGECRKNIRMREMLSFLLKAFPLPEFLFERPPIFRATVGPCRRMDRPVRETCAVGPEGVERGTCDVRLRPSFRSREKVVVESSSFFPPSLSLPCLLPSFFFASCVVWSEI